MRVKIARSLGRKPIRGGSPAKERRREIEVAERGGAMECREFVGVEVEE